MGSVGSVVGSRSNLVGTVVDGVDGSVVRDVGGSDVRGVGGSVVGGSIVIGVVMPAK